MSQEIIQNDLLGKSTVLSVVTNDEDSVSLYPATPVLKGRNDSGYDSSMIKDASSSMKKYLPDSLEAFRSPRSTLKRSKPVDPSNRPIVKKLTEVCIEVHERSTNISKRRRSDTEPDLIDNFCGLKPKRLKFSECLTPLNAADVQSDEYHGRCVINEGLNSDEKFERVELEAEEGNIPSPQTGASKCLPNYENFSNYKGTSSSGINTNGDVGTTEDTQTVPCITNCVKAITSSIRDSDAAAIEVEVAEGFVGRWEETEVYNDQMPGHFSSPGISDHTSPYLLSQSQPTSLNTSSPVVSNQAHAKLEERENEQAIISSPMISEMRGSRLSMTGNRVRMPIPFFDRPRSTSTPMRSGGLVPFPGLGQGYRERPGPSGDAGYNLITDYSHELELLDADPLLGFENNTNGTETTSGSQTLFNEEADRSCQPRSLPTVNEGDCDGSTIYYPDSSSEPDRQNISGDTSSFLILEPTGQRSSESRHGSNGRSRSNSNLNSSQRFRQTTPNRRRQMGVPSARRHLDFSPMMGSRDHVVPPSIMDPED